jgi:hypothetical protein
LDNEIGVSDQLDEPRTTDRNWIRKRLDELTEGECDVGRCSGTFIRDFDRDLAVAYDGHRDEKRDLIIRSPKNDGLNHDAINQDIELDCGITTGAGREVDDAFRPGARTFAVPNS